MTAGESPISGWSRPERGETHRFAGFSATEAV